MRRASLLFASGVFLVSGTAVLIRKKICKKVEHRLLEDSAELPDLPVVIIPGARVYENGDLSSALSDRLETAVRLYENKKVAVVLISGDPRPHRNDEVTAMKQWLLRRGIPPDAMILDDRGYRTLETMRRARDVFKVDRAVICTQRDHLPRAVFLARSFGIDVFGLPADRRHYRFSLRARLRELAAGSLAYLEILAK